MKTILV